MSRSVNHLLADWKTKMRQEMFDVLVSVLVESRDPQTVSSRRRSVKMTS